jgi:hypothetical protein
VIAIQYVNGSVVWNENMDLYSVCKNREGEGRLRRREAERAKEREWVENI